MLAIHNLFLWGHRPDTWTIFAMVGWAVGTISVGSLLLNRLRGEIRDVL